jgi:hypothetical protein
MNKRYVVHSPVLAISAMASGAALVAAILLRVSLGLTLVMLACTAALVVVLRISRLSPPVRMQLKAQALTGVLIGSIATVAYDLSRLLLVKLGQLNFHPFKTFVLFGYALLGEAVPQASAFAAGTVYHFINGITFAVAYCLLFSGCHWVCGLLWALGLEVAMFTLYPGWLDLEAVIVEFTVVSLTGHLAYGATLGALSQRWFHGRPRIALGVKR